MERSFPIETIFENLKKIFHGFEKLIKFHMLIR